MEFKMGDVRWPAVAIQSIFLVLNSAFLLAGKNNVFIIASTACLVFLFHLQVVSKNKRFLFLYPINMDTGESSIGYDTWILRGLIIISILLFFIGATGQIIIPIIIMLVGIIIPILWDKFFENE
jgi:hypothetical protein